MDAGVCHSIGAEFMLTSAASSQTPRVTRDETVGRDTAVTKMTSHPSAGCFVATVIQLPHSLLVQQKKGQRITSEFETTATS